MCNDMDNNSCNNYVNAFGDEAIIMARHRN